MNRSFSKIRHIQEVNQRLEKSLINEKKVEKLLTIDDYTKKRLKERGFKEVPSNTYMELRSPKTTEVIKVYPSEKHKSGYGGWKLVKGSKVVFDLPHDDCDVELDKFLVKSGLKK